jgi:hypothetical protein
VGIELALGRVQWRVLVLAAMNLRIMLPQPQGQKRSRD